MTTSDPTRFRTAGRESRGAWGTPVYMLAAMMAWVGMGAGPLQAFRFVDRTAALGLTGLGTGPACWIDFNNDGWVDLYADGSLWINHNGTSFTPINLGFGPGMWGDIDNDGYPDFFCCTTRKLYHNNGGTGSLTEVPLPALPMTSCYYGVSFADYDNDGPIDLYVGGDEDSGYLPDALLRNLGGTSFAMTLPEPADALKPARGVTSCDFDEDGDQDIYVSNYRLAANYLWIKDRMGNFTDVAGAYGVDGAFPYWGYRHSIGACWGDLDNDGHFDLFSGNFAHPENYFGAGTPRQGESQFFRNLGPAGNWHFQDMSAGAGLAYQESYESPVLGDYDNDGNLDLYITTIYSGDHCVLYRNNGNWTFTDVTNAEGLGGLGMTYQAAWADFNHDGKLDLATAGRLFVNSGDANNWLEVRLRADGTVVNRAAVGAQVRVNMGSQMLTRQVEAGTGSGNENDFTLHFGLGNAWYPVNLEIRWPDRTTTTLTNIAVDRIITQDRAPCLVVTPADTLAASGPQGGPFSPAAMTYTLTNTANNTIRWTAAGPAWITLSPAGGYLYPQTSVTMTTSLNATANTLAASGPPYTGTLTFTNTTNGSGTTSRGASLTVQPVLKGTLALGDFAASPAAVGCTIQLWQSGSLVRAQAVALDSQSRFTVANVATGTYTVKVLSPHWLVKAVTNVQMTATGADMGAITLTNGDCDGNNEVAENDLTILLAAVDSSQNDSGFDPRADLDGDQEITSTDLAIVLKNLGRTGSP